MNIHYTIHKVADLLGISADAIRLYEWENHTVKSNMTALHDTPRTCRRSSVSSSRSPHARICSR